MPLPLPLPLLLLAALAAAPDAGSAAPADATPQALVFGGGQDAAAAAQWRARWDEERDLLADVIELAPGFPKVVRSDEVPGLNPGFHIVLLGVCRDREGRDARGVLGAAFPFLYEKRVKLEAADACPRLASGARRLEETRTARTKAASLTALSVKMERSLEQGETLERTLLVVARDAKGKRLGDRSYEDVRDGVGTGCESELTDGRAGEIVLLRSCTRPVGAYCNRYPGEKARVALRWNGDALVEDEKTIEKWEIDFDRDCAE